MKHLFTLLAIAAILSLSGLMTGCSNSTSRPLAEKPSTKLTFTGFTLASNGNELPKIGGVYTVAAKTQVAIKLAGVNANDWVECKFDCEDKTVMLPGSLGTTGNNDLTFAINKAALVNVTVSAQGKSFSVQVRFTDLPAGRAGVDPSQNGLTLALFNFRDLALDEKSPLVQTSRTEYECNEGTVFGPSLALSSRGGIRNDEIYLYLTDAFDNEIKRNFVENLFDRGWALESGIYKVKAFVKLSGLGTSLSVWLNVKRDPNKAAISMDPRWVTSGDPAYGYVYLPVTCEKDSPQVAQDVKVFGDISPDGVMTFHATADNGQTRPYNLTAGKTTLMDDGTVRINETGATFRGGGNITDPASLKSGIRIGNLAPGQTREVNFRIHLQSLPGTLTLTDQNGTAIPSSSSVAVGSTITATASGTKNDIRVGFIGPDSSGQNIGTIDTACLSSEGKYVFYIFNADGSVGASAIVYAGEGKGG